MLSRALQARRIAQLLRCAPQRCITTIRDVTTIDALATIPCDQMITFSIVAHIDHGKSSLSQRLLEHCGNIDAAAAVGQDALDTLAVERERGITVKAVSASMVHDYEGQKYLVNLVDTPGHADFAHEVVRSLGACDGALLLVDAAQGVEAQTLKVADAARAAGVPLLAACSKVDLPTANAVDVALDVAARGLVEDPEAVLAVSAKSGLGVADVLDAVCGAFRPPADDGARRRPLRARVLDSRYDPRRGVVSVLRVVDGELREGDRVRFKSADGRSYGVQELGLLTPAQQRTKGLVAGCVGYVACGLRDVRDARVGDTLVADSEAGADAAPLPGGVAPSAPALYASVFPPDGAAFDDMAKAVERLAVNDASVSIAREPPRASLGLGLRLGFLGLLHLDVFRQRLRDEFAEDVLFTAPLVPYRVRWRDGTTTELATLDDWPSAEEQRAAVDAILEPSVTVDVAAPRDHLGAVLEVLENARGAQRSLDVDGDRAAVAYDAPWALVVDGLAEELAHATQGYASLSVRSSPTYVAADVVKVDVALNGVAVDALAFAAARGEAQRRGRAAAARLKAVVPRQLFEVVIQARVGTKSLARERLPPLRKDVLTTKAGKNVGGGDVTRKKKLLEKQKKGKAKQKTIGNVSLGQDALWAVVRSGEESP